MGPGFLSRRIAVLIFPRRLQLGTAHIYADAFAETVLPFGSVVDARSFATLSALSTDAPRGTRATEYRNRAAQ